MTPHKRDQADQNVLLLLGSWLKKLWSTFGAPSGRWSEGRITRAIVYFTLFLWLMLLVWGLLKLHQPIPAIMPLYAFYPGQLVSANADFNPTLMHAWGVGVGIFCLALAITATWRKSRLVAIIFMVFFLASTLISCARILGGLQSIHQ
jgi:hypothetical protein